MRTTLTIDDPTARALKDLAHRTGRSFKEVVNETLRSGLRNSRSVEPKPYRLEPASMGEVRGDFDLHKALELAAKLEDEEINRKLQLRK